MSEAALVTDLDWNPRVFRPGRERRGALVGTLLGVPVTGKDCGRSTAYQLGTIFGDVRTVWWDGEIGAEGPRFYDVDTDAPVSGYPPHIVWFARLDQIGAQA